MAWVRWGRVAEFTGTLDFTNENAPNHVELHEESTPQPYAGEPLTARWPIEPLPGESVSPLGLGAWVAQWTVMFDDTCRYSHVLVLRR